jgi:predicted phosphodiesterase
VRRVTLAVLALFLLSISMLGCGGSGDTIEEHPMRFAVIGDRTGWYQPGIYEQIVQEVQRMKPDFILTVGDHVEGYTDDTITIKDEWEEYLKSVESFTMPIYFTPGNHDIGDSTARELYRRYIGEPYYSFDIRGVHFISLDNSIPDVIDDFATEQIEWLAQDLEENKEALYTIVHFHKPFWIETIAKGQPDTLHALFAQYGVDAVFTGHYHRYFSGEFDGVKYTGVGSSGGYCSPGPTGLEFHFMWVTVDADGISISPIRKDAVLAWDEVTAAEFNFVGEIQDQAMRIENAPLGADLTVPKTEIGVRIKNLNDQFGLSDTLSWEAPDGWTVTPQSVPVRVGPGNACTFNFSVKSTGSVYPTPEVSLQYPYAEGKKFELTDDLGVSRTVYAYQAKKSPSIDGRLTEGIWKSPTTKFFGPDGSAMFTDPVYFYFAWDKDNLYIAAKCMETKMDSIRANVKEHDGAVYGEDCVGYFLQPQTEDGPAYQIYFNPLGTPFDQKILVKDGLEDATERDWNGTYDVKTFRGDDYWSIEARIPLDQLDTENQSGKKWSLNFRRKQKRLDTSADWLVPISYDPKDYGILVLK